LPVTACEPVPRDASARRGFGASPSRAGSWCAAFSSASAKCGPMSCRPTGKPSGEPAGNRQRRQAGEVRADGVDVVQVHRDRVGDLRARARRPAWATSGPPAGRHLLERAAKSSLIRCRQLLRLEVIGVVVAGGQHVGARHDAPLDLGAEALGARALCRGRAGPGAPRSGSRSARRRSARLEEHSAGATT
jgi:hypothetical protein